MCFMHQWTCIEILDNSDDFILCSIPVPHPASDVIVWICCGKCLVDHGNAELSLIREATFCQLEIEEVEIVIVCSSDAVPYLFIIFTLSRA